MNFRLPYPVVCNKSNPDFFFINSKILHFVLLVLIPLLQYDIAPINISANCNN